MSNHSTRPRILFVTPEVVFVPERAGNCAYCIGASSGSFGDFLAELITDLLILGVDVHVAQPDYRKLFEMLSWNEQVNPNLKLPSDRVHLAEDRAFFYSNPIKTNFAFKWDPGRPLCGNGKFSNSVEPCQRPEQNFPYMPLAGTGRQILCRVCLRNGLYIRPLS